MWAAGNGYIRVVEALLASGANEAGGSGAQSRKVQREFAAVMLAWFELFCVTLVVETAITHKIRGFEAQSCPGLRFAPKRKGASE